MSKHTQELLAKIAEQAREIERLAEINEAERALTKRQFDVINELNKRIAALKQSISNAVVMPEPDFYWVEADEGSWNSPEEWAQDYYDYNGEKPESVSFSCAIELPNREYDSFEFDADGSCISCRIVNDEVARLNPSRGVPVVAQLDYELLKLAMQGVKDQLASCEQALEQAWQTAAPAQPDQCGVVVPRELQDEAERCAFVFENIGSMDAEDIYGDGVDLRFEDEDGRDTGCDVSIVEYAERTAKLLRALLAGGVE